MGRLGLSPLWCCALFLAALFITGFSAVPYMHWGLRLAAQGTAYQHSELDEWTAAEAADQQGCGALIFERERQRAAVGQSQNGHERSGPSGEKPSLGLPSSLTYELARKSQACPFDRRFFVYYDTSEADEFWYHCRGESFFCSSAFVDFLLQVLSFAAHA